MTREELVTAEAIKMRDAHRMTGEPRASSHDADDGWLPEELPGAQGDQGV